MAFFEFPHTRTYDSDLGWLVKSFNEISEKLDQYLENAVIKFADPITWDITEQYTALTCVVDSDGTAYLSKQPVPAGVDITNTNYWLPIFNYDDNINTLRDQIAYNARTNATTGVDLKENDLVFWNGLIYRVLVDMPAGTAFIIDTNIEKYTVDEKINDLSDYVDGKISDLSDDINTLRDQIAYNAGTSATTGVDLKENDLVFWNGLIYRVLTDMSAGTAFLVGTNVEQYTVDEKINVLSEKIQEIDRNQIFTDPVQFGAVGDGVTDDTAAFEDAISTGKPLFIPNRTFNITRPLFIAQDVWCKGELVNNNLLDITGVDTGVYGGYAMIYLTGTNQIVEGMRVRDTNISSYWNGSGSSGASMYGGFIVHGRNITMIDCISHVPLWGLLILSPNGGSMRIIRGNFTGGIGLINEVFNNPSSIPYEDIVYENCVFKGNLCAGTGNSDNTTFIGCRFLTFPESTQFLLRVARNDALISYKYTHPVFISCNFIDNKAHAIGNYSAYISGYNPTDPSDFGEVKADFYNCTYEIVHNYNNDYIAIEGGSRASFHNCKIQAKILEISSHTSDLAYLTLDNCDVIGNSANGPAVVGKYLDAVISHCTFSDSGSNASTSGYIDVLQAMIESCKFNDCYRAPINANNYAESVVAYQNECDYSALAQLGTTSYKFYGLYNIVSGGGPNILDGSKSYPPVNSSATSRLYNPKTGDLVYALDTNKLMGYNGSSWINLT